MKTSNKGIELIKKFEGCRLTAYRCPAGVLTIGYGHTGSDVKAGMTISQSRAVELLKSDLARFENNVAKYNSKYKWNQNQYDALVSFAYNIGSIDQLTANGTRSIKEISNAILKYNKAGGKELAGLTSRRKEEKKLFDTKAGSSNNNNKGGNTGKKSINQIAKEVIAGKYGDGPERIKKLKAAGYDPYEVQKVVNNMLK